MKEHMKRKTSGITLIALVVTIIVLLILAGISIMMLSGNNGILNRAGEAKKRTDEEQIIEEARMDILSTQTAKLSDKITQRDLKSILSKYGTLSIEEENILDKKITTFDENYVIPVSKIYNGNLLETTIENTDQKSYYGDSIDYDVDLGKYTDGITDLDLDGKPQYDWKIFYNDGTNIYIIAEDYVPMSKCSNLTTTITNRVDGGTIDPYGLYWYIKNGNIQNGKNGSADIFGTNAPSQTLSFANKFLTDWKPKVTGTNSASENSNAKMVATLMDTSLWANFATSTKINGLTNKADELSAIGGPTLEMWVKSWNKKHGAESKDTSKLQLYYASNATGYFVGTTENPETSSSDYVYQSGTTGYTDTLYYPVSLDSNGNPDTNKCFGYWLASPSAYGADYVMRVSKSGLVKYYNISQACYGVRPVVCLPSDITATWNETEGVWNIIKK